MTTGDVLTIERQRASKTILWVIGVVAVILVGVALFSAAAYFVADDEDMPVVLTSDDNGSSYQMDLDEEIVIALDSNATTGYEWAIDELDEAVVRLLGSSYIAPNNGAVGQGGTEEWSFEAVEPGTTLLSLKYWRPWEGDASVAERFEMTLEVHD